MALKKLFRPFRRRLLTEAAIKALLFGLLCGGIGLFGVSLFYHLLKTQPRTEQLITPVLWIFGIAFLLAFLLQYPTKKRIAKRLDESGLKERAVTMLEMQNSDKEMAKLQREDACKRIEKFKPKKVRFKINERHILIPFIALMLAVAMLVVPYDIFMTEADVIAMEQQLATTIEDIVRRLRQQVQLADIDEDTRQELFAIINQLEMDLQEARNDLECIALIEEAKEKINTLIEASLTGSSIGEALQKYPFTQKLGEAISEMDLQLVKYAMWDLKLFLTYDPNLIRTFSENIRQALDDSRVSAKDDLYIALNQGAVAVSSLQEMDTDTREFRTTLETMMDATELAIIGALQKQLGLSSMRDELEDTMNDAQDQLNGEEGESGEEENPEGESPDGDGEGNVNIGGEEEESGDPNAEAPADPLTETVYDPDSGNVPYGEVFIFYYTEYLTALENGEVPEELQQIIDGYFAALNP